MLQWRGTYATRAALEERIGARMLPFVAESISHTSVGWKLAFNPDEMQASQKALNGDHWADWLATDCPALVLRGRDSKVTTQAHIDEMVAMRPNTRGLTLEGGHVLHFENPVGFNAAVIAFLQSLPATLNHR